jgi:hypothetical protein
MMFIAVGYVLVQIFIISGIHMGPFNAGSSLLRFGTESRVCHVPVN